jgi:xanthine dehydrogenase accessory factor
LERLRDAGLDEESIARIHAPCGLDIGARTPPETVVSILAEVIAVRTGRGGESLRETSGPIHGQGVAADSR